MGPEESVFYRKRGVVRVGLGKEWVNGLVRIGRRVGGIRDVSKVGLGGWTGQIFSGNLGKLLGWGYGYLLGFLSGWCLGRLLGEFLGKVVADFLLALWCKWRGEEWVDVSDDSDGEDVETIDRQEYKIPYKTQNSIRLYNHHCHHNHSSLYSIFTSPSYSLAFSFPISPKISLTNLSASHALPQEL